MRKIKYRAWSFGSFVYIETNKDLKYWVHDSTSGPIETISKFNWEQFIGLYDKHGKEIYEGDYIRLSCLCCCYEIIWDEKNCRFWPKDDGLSQEHYKDIDIWSCELEVVGNNHENPDFLKS